MSRPDETDLATVAARSVTEATAIPPDNLPDDPRAYLAWLRDPNRPVRRSKPRRRLAPVPEPAGYPAHETRDPAYTAATETLRRLPDLGAASLEVARQALGDVQLERLVIHAAAHPVIPAAPLELDTPNPRTDTPACGCGTALDPDGTCLTCTNGTPA